MDKLIIKRTNNYMIRFRALKVFVDDKFVGFIEPNEKCKEIAIETSNHQLRLKVDWCYSNILYLKRDDKGILIPKTIQITSQIHNGLFVLIFGCFITGNILMILDNINPFVYLSLISPLSIIVGWQTFGRKNYLRLANVSKQ